MSTPDSNNGGGYGRFTSATNDSSTSYAAPTTNDGEAQKKPAPAWVSNFVKGTAGRLYPGVDFSNIRRENAGLNEGGENSPVERTPEPEVVPGKTNTTTVPLDQDWRVRISLPPNSKAFYQDPGWKGRQWPLMDTGVIFPYTPTISITHAARYQEQALTHSNYKNYFYEGSDVSSITVTGDFTVQNQQEGEYVLACIYFFRAATKMFFGRSGSYPVGTPPPIVFLDGYGDYYLPHVSCVITQFQHTMPADVDYIPLIGLNQRMPTISQISVTLQPVLSRKRIHEEFNLDAYGKGDLTGRFDNVKIGGFL